MLQIVRGCVIIDHDCRAYPAEETGRSRWQKPVAEAGEKSC